MSDPAMRSVAIEDVAATIVDIVRSGVANRPDGVYLTWVGGEFSRLRKASFEQFLSHIAISENLNIPPAQRRMSTFIEDFCSDTLRLVRTSNQNYLARLVDVQDLGAEVSLPASENVGRGIAQRRYKKGVWPAFIRPIAHGQRRFLDVERFTFTDTDNPPEGAHWREIESRYVAAIPANDPVDSSRIEERIEEWCKVADFDSEALTISGVVENPPTLSDLARIIAALPPSISSNWMIPADVIRHLR